MKKMRVALALVVSAFMACFTQAEGAAATSLPKATVTQCAPLTLTAAEHDYMVWPSGDDTVARPLQIVMNFKAQETLEEAKAGAYGKYKCDFYLTIEGLAGDSITADGCYLAGNYGSFGWIVIPTDGTELEEGVSYPIVSAYDANLTYEDICGSVKDFTAAIYVAPTILAANPDFKVALALKMTDPNNEANVLTIGTPATYTVKDLLPLPTATVTTVKNDDLTFALNFKADSATEAQLATYGDWYADFVLTVNKDVTFNANGGADGYLSGQYDEWSENWVNVPFEDVTLKANESLKIMAYAAEMMNQGGLKLTYNDVVSFVKDFDCGVFFEPEFLIANPDLKVTLELRMYNPANEAESYVIGETYTFPVPLPTATVTELNNEDLTFALNFKADSATDAQLATYGDWYADFVLTVNKDVTFNANDSENANGYLSGQYDEWSENWVNVPFEDVTLKANESLKIMAYAAEMMNQGGLKLTYNDVVSFVKDFDCGVFFEPAFLAANPDLKVTLELRMYNPANEAVSYVIGETYTFNIPTVEVKNEVETDTMSDKQKEAVAEIVTNTVVTKADTGLLDATAEITAAKEALKNQDGVTAEAVANAVPVIAITVKTVEFIDEEPSKLTFDVTPTLSVGETSVKMSTFEKALTFRLPIPTEWAGLVKVSHAGTLMGTYTIQESEGAKYVEVSSASFSEFAIEPIDTALVAKIGETPYETLEAAFAAATEGQTITLISDVQLAETLTIPAGKTVTLDLNGKSISMEESIVTTTYAINNLGTLTLKDSVGTGSVNARGIYNGYGNGGENVPSAKLIVQGGTYNAKGTNGGAAIFNYGIAEINGGSFTSIGGYSLNNQAGSLMTIADGVTANNGIYCSNATVTVNGGNISGNRSGCHVVYAWNSTVTINGGDFYNNNSGNSTLMAAGTTKMTVNGGTFGIKDGRVPGNGNTWTSCLTDTANTATMTVTGGTFNGGFRVQAGTTMTIEGGSYNDCYGSKYNIYGTVTVKGGTFTDDTAKKFAANNLAAGYTLGENGAVVAPVAKIGDTPYTTFADALNAAKAMTGDVTVEVLEKVTLNGPLSGSYASIKFVGKDTDAEIYLDVQGYVEAAGKKVAFEDLKLSKVAGGYITNAGFMNLAFGIFGATEVAYTNCTFLNGAYASSGKNTFTGCTFYRSHDRYGLWAYGAANIVVDGCTFADIRGIKMYDEGKAGTTNITVKNTDFTAADNKPAIVLTYGQSVTLENNTYSSKGVFELDLDGAPNGVTVTSDVAPTCVNDNGACGVLVDGKIYTTVAQAAAVATAGSTVTLLHDSAETVEFAVGVNLNKNGFTADGITVKQPVAQIGEQTYTTIAAAIAAAQAGDTVIILPGEYGAIDISNKNITIKGTVGDNGELLTTIKGGNPAITGHNFNGTIKDIKIVDAFKVMYAEPAGNVTVDNVYVTGATYGFHLVAYTQGLTWTIQNSYMNLSWANSFGVSGNGDAAIVIKGNTFASTKPYYPDYGALAVNTFLPNVTVEGNVFGENAKIMVRESIADTSKINISKNYHADGVDNAFVDDSAKVGIYAYYSDAALQNLVVRAAKIGDTYYASLEAAAAVAQAGDEIVLLLDATLTEKLTLPAGIKLNGNGKSITGAEVWADGNLEFVGHTKVTMFNAGYNKPTITIGEGACLELTSTGRMVIGHGATFNITGTITDAKTANVADITPSLIAAGASFTGAGVNFNVTNAYVKFTAYCSSKNSSANDTFNINVNNSIWEQTGSLVFTEPTNGKDPTFNFNVVNSVLNSTSHLVFAVTKGEIVFDNSNVNVGAAKQLENRSTLTIKNGSVVYAAHATSSNAKNPGTTIVENATLVATGEFSGSDVGTGTLIVKKGANVTMGKITKANIQIDATDMTEGELANFTANLSGLTGTLTVVNNDKLEAKIVDGKIVLSAKPVAKIGDTPYATLEDAFKAATEGCTIEILSDVTIDYKWDCRDYVTGGSHSQFNESVTINGNGHTLKFTGTVSDGNWNTIFRFEENATVNNLIVDISGATGAQRVISAKKSLTVDGLTIVGSAKYGIIFGEGASADDLAAAEIVVTNSTLTGTRRAISDNEGGKDVKSVVITGNTLKANVYASASESITFNNNTAAGEVDLRSYTAETVLKVEAKGNTLTAGVKNYIYAKDINAQADFTSERPWDGVTIANLKQLKMFRDAVNAGDTYAGKTVTLAADIDLGNDEWAPIGSDKNHAFKGVFDGQNKTISNLKIADEDLDCAGLFGYATGATIKNVNIKNVDIKAYSHAAPVVGHMYTGNIENCHVSGSIKVVAQYAYAAGITADGYVNVRNCSVIADEATRGVITVVEKTGAGGITGWRGEGNLVIENCTVKNLDITAWASLGGISGIVHYNNTVKGCVVENVTLTKTRENGQASVGLVCGNWEAKKDGNYTITVTDNTFKNITINGTAINSLKQLCGSKYSTYDTDIKLVESGNTYDAITSNLKVVARTFADFKNALAYADAGETITLLADIEATEVMWVSKSLTINGNGFKIASTATRIFRVNASDIEVTFNDVNFVSNAVRAAGIDSIRGVSIDPNYTDIELTLNNCSVDFTDASAIDCSYAINVSGGTGHTLTIDGGTYEGANVINVWGSNHIVTVKNTTLNSIYMNSEAYYGACIWVEQNQGSSVEATGNTFNGNNTVAFNLGTGTTLTESNNTDNTKYVVAKIGAAYYTSLADAIAVAQAGETVTLLQNVESSEIIVINKAITLNGNGKTLTSTAGRAINVSGANGVTIKNLTINASGERAINIIQNATNVTIDNVKATAANYTINVASSAPNAVVAIKNSTLNGLCTVNVSAVGAQVTVDKSIINCNDNNTTEGESYAALSLNMEAVGGSIVATNTTVNVAEGSDSVAGRNGAENGTVTINGSTEGITVTVATITYEGSPYYHSFQTLAKAIEFAKAGDTITLIRDVTLTQTIVVAKSITIDGNGKTLTYTGNGASARAIDVPNNADAKVNVTIKNLTVDCTASYCQRGINYNDDGALTLKGVTVKGTNVTYALNLPGSSDNATVVIEDSALTGNIALNVWGENVTITATNTAFTSVDTATHENYSAIALNNDGTTIANGTIVTITGGSITALDENGEPSNAIRNATSTGSVNVRDTTVVNGNYTKPVAIVDYGTDQFYSCVTLQQAINKAIETNGSVKLLTDTEVSEIIKVDGAVVIDLNDKTVTGTAKKVFEVYANTTIKNGTITGVNRCVDTRKAVELTLTDVTLVADQYTAAYANPQPLTIGGSEDGTKVTMSNVTINAGTSGYGIITFVKTNLTAEDSTISGYSALYVKPGSEESTFAFVKSMLSGSTGSNDVEGNSFSAIAIRANTVAVTMDADSTLTATGNFCSALSLGGSYAGEETVANATVTIAGTIEGYIVSATTLNSNTIKVKAEYADDLLAEGYCTGEAYNGLVVILGKTLAQIGDKYYASVEAALAAAQAGTKVTVMNREAAEAFGEKLVATGGKKGAAAYDVATLLGGSFKKTAEGTLHYDYAFGVSNVAYAGNDKFTVTVAIKDADSTVARELTGRTLVLRMVVEGDTPEADVIEDIRIDEDLVFTVAADDQVTFDVTDVALPEAGEGKATYFTVKVTDEE